MYMASLTILTTTLLWQQIEDVLSNQDDVCIYTNTIIYDVRMMVYTCMWIHYLYMHGWDQQLAS